MKLLKRRVKQIQLDLAGKKASDVLGPESTPEERYKENQAYLKDIIIVCACTVVLIPLALWKLKIRMMNKS